YVYVPVAGVVGPRTAERALAALCVPLKPQEGRQVHQWLVQAVRTTDAPVIDALTRPTWREGRLLVPGINAPSVPAGFSLPRPEGDEEEARQVWARILQVAAAYPALGFLMGHAVGSLYLEQLGVSG